MLMGEQPIIPESFTQKNFFRIQSLYGEEQAIYLLEKIISLMKDHLAVSPLKKKVWNESDIILITYGDSIKEEGKMPLATLYKFLNTYMREAVSAVHILPFFPYSSDDGFSIIDYRKVNEELGSWEDIHQIGENFDLMVDLVLNHLSSQSEWFQKFLAGKEKYKDYFIEMSPDTDLSKVVRPRTTPALVPYQTVNGETHVWATFSADQIDVNYQNPDVLIEFIQILLFYVRQGARYLRLDAVAFLWKQLGTSCIHLDQTHEVIKLFREILDMVAPQCILITETNVPAKENFSYFGNSDEAQMIYQFSLPPLLLHALHFGTSEYLSDWADNMPIPPRKCTYLNFTASHDGIGLRPVEGLLPKEEINRLVEDIRKSGGYISLKDDGNGKGSPYELNISLFDALAGISDDLDQWQIPRFLCSQVINLSLRGIPAVYIHSLTATPNDHSGVEKTQQNRSINRHKWNYPKLRNLVANNFTPNATVFTEYRRLLRIRRNQSAFHPDAAQEILHIGNSFFGIRRQSVNGSQEIISISNLTDQRQVLDLSLIRKIRTSQVWYDLIGKNELDGSLKQFTMKPFQSMWLTVIH
ncbi:MAG: glycosidase [bacterium]